MNVKKVKKIDEKISTFLFNLRNKNYVRKNSTNYSKIKLKNHNQWIKKFLKTKNKLYIVKKGKLPIGYVRLELKRNIYNTSWALTKKFQGKGYAKKSLSYVTRNRRYKYKALIKTKNIASIKIATQCLFKFRTKKSGIAYLYKN
tara:strand:- start:160 stop:591 length:432 start_codon:yes stop_codon:yes gene_type:complete